MNDFFEKNKLFFSSPTLCLGSTLSEAELLSIAKQKYPGKEYSILNQWLIIDILNSDSNQDTKDHDGTRSILAFAQEDYTLSKDKVSSYATVIEDCFFVTVKSVYILTGRGFRHSISEDLAAYLINA